MRVYVFCIQIAKNKSFVELKTHLCLSGSAREVKPCSGLFLGASKRASAKFDKYAMLAGALSGNLPL